jgi:hypothetical protein
MQQLHQVGPASSYMTRTAHQQSSTISGIMPAVGCVPYTTCHTTPHVTESNTYWKQQHKQHTAMLIHAAPKPTEPANVF